MSLTSSPSVRMSISMENTSAMTAQSPTPQSRNDSALVVLSQTFLCFDLESEEDATQKTEIRRNVDGMVAWRIRTNAPTRYIVNPNSGILDATNSIAKVVIQLVDNNFHPSHELIVQAIQIDDPSHKNVWKSERAKAFGEVQTIKLELSTTIVNFDNLQQETEAQQSSLAKILLHDRISYHEQMNELTELLKLLESDCQSVRNNMIKASRLKEVLQKSLVDKESRLKEIKKDCEKMDLEAFQLKQKLADSPSCSIS